MADLERFVSAQAPVHATVLAELRAGRKQSHWMWFIFPQLVELGRSPMAKFYGIAGLEEARRIWPMMSWGHGWSSARGW
jgi:uncharacterized protein (DUF1810 family)